MKKEELKKNINEIKKITSQMPKSLNEALNFNQLENEGEEVEFEDELPEEAPVEKVEAPVAVEEDDNIKNFIATMRKQSLQIMAQLSDTPDNPTYEFAKRIFQLAEKAHQDEKEGKDINGQPKQAMPQLDSQI